MISDSTSVTITQAINCGLKKITTPSNIILYSATVLCILVLIWDFSWRDLLAIPLGLLVSYLYSMYATPKWKIWAYSSVTDIHQFQRSAELAGLLLKGSHESTSGVMNSRQMEILKNLQKKFLEEPVFADDPSIPGETAIPEKSFFGVQSGPMIVLNGSGLQLRSTGYFDWGQIEDEHIAKISQYRSYGKADTNNIGYKVFFVFNSPAEHFEIPLSSLKITAWQLDLLLYVYRGRYMQNQIAA